MTEYIATFHTYFAALQTYRQLQALGMEASLSPVPRTLSTDCGTCVRYRAESPLLEQMHQDFDRVVTATGYQTVAENKE